MWRGGQAGLVYRLLLRQNYLGCLRMFLQIAEMEFCVLTSVVTVCKLNSLKATMKKEISLPSLPKVSVFMLLASQPKPDWCTPTDVFQYFF